ncbi:hypothetical protein ACIREO_12860 [Streptomyces sp. NPDC102441]|uniref:hypothetical protein n=1 Tax=Streptomyces sp. NPDC102441 TaxID=3366176 RepID=UPI0038170ACA
MHDLAFYAHVAACGEVLGVGIGSQPAEWKTALGGDYLDIESQGLLRRDYGLVELSFQQEEGSWTCFGISVQVHRLRLDTAAQVPAALQHRYGPFSPRARFDKLSAEITDQGYVIETDNDAATTDIHRYKVLGSGVRILVVAESSPASTDSGFFEGTRAGDVHRLSVSPAWWQSMN